MCLRNTQSERFFFFMRTTSDVKMAREWLSSLAGPVMALEDRQVDVFAFRPRKKGLNEEAAVNEAMARGL